eukprot:CAMPEP_0113329854 /NCGR_PEP_ID=MMETSP0010_2-20120614/21197_1 /TAXON_ID=216773 ORGANISM="Corethron hystrix, Strain 308" /NCGR_SAMPLE_ID=MMETSP0010_2 /ASSEMBLY_ACC=CAM_ASM_000155 /LENGTH=150 /DNA_ID=CAMNT_0000192121 /DNA_START=77 /DNA_END=526 /DNA_ORIENTATION=- /assembly_acc=CAM_ASM_000155
MKIGSDFDGKESAAADKPEEKKRSVPPGFRWLYGLQFGHNYNASGWAMDGSARGFVINSNVYLGAAIVEMAMVEAGCDGQGQCDKQIFGFKATSILTNLQLYVGLISAIFMPFVGAIVDNTRFRWHVGAITAAIMVCINAFQIAVWSKLW